MKQHIVLIGEKKTLRKESSFLYMKYLVTAFFALVSSLILIQMATIHISGGILVGQRKK